jgi:hypothetical protein
MSESLKKKLREALANPGMELTLTSVEERELDAYLALVGYFETQMPGGNA